MKRKDEKKKKFDKRKTLKRRGRLLKDPLKNETEEVCNDTDSICSDATDTTDVSCTSVLSNISSCRVDLRNMKGLKDAKIEVIFFFLHVTLL